MKFRIVLLVALAGLLSACGSPGRQLPESHAGFYDLGCAQKFDLAKKIIDSGEHFEAVVDCLDEATGTRYAAYGVLYHQLTDDEFAAYLKETEGKKRQPIDRQLAAWQNLLRQGLANQTITDVRDRFGYQVEYHSPDGKAYLWFPGNNVVVEGEWKARDVLLCYKYGPNAQNAVTGEPGGDWKCTIPMMNRPKHATKAEGDIYNLSSGKVPHIMSPSVGPQVHFPAPDADEAESEDPAPEN